jgi:ABC-type oligopeptide transport system substrate-binding subunit
MKFLFSIAVLLSTTLLFSCSEKTTPNETGVSEEVEENQQNTSETGVVEQRTVTGKFRSVSGVMDKLSCYCSNGGYVTSEDGVVTAVCFDEAVESCDKITVTGYMTSRKIEKNGSCPEGIMGFLKAQSYVVGETDY